MEGKPLDEQYSWEACDRWSSREDYQWKMNTLRLKKVITYLCLAYFCLLFFKWMAKPSSKKKHTWESHRHTFLWEVTPALWCHVCDVYMCDFPKITWGAQEQPTFSHHPESFTRITKDYVITSVLFHIFQSRRDFLLQAQNEESILSLFNAISQICTANLSAVISHWQIYLFFLFSLLWWGMSLWDQSGPGGVIVRLLPIL